MAKNISIKEKEVWKDIPGYVGRYKISNLGRVLAPSRRVRFVSKKGSESFRIRKQKNLSTPVMNNEYKGVWLCKTRKGKFFKKVCLVHVLVARAFLSGSGETVNHKNGIKTDNFYRNLEWASYSENHNHAVRTGLNKQAMKIIGRKINGRKVIKAFSLADAAFKLTGNRGNSSVISAHLRGKKKAAFGYVWSRI